ncbi:TPA: hypothetical protein RMT71_003158 [Escherichia coli]|nr:hypothetical protein [Escherichia coli]HDW3986165.1 hypothetical protein [Escherichia coli]
MVGTVNSYVPFHRVVSVMTQAGVTLGAATDFLAAYDERKGVPSQEMIAFVRGEEQRVSAFLTEEE